jgi:hypothetical protein
MRCAVKRCSKRVGTLCRPRTPSVSLREDEAGELLRRSTRAKKDEPNPSSSVCRHYTFRRANNAGSRPSVPAPEQQSLIGCIGPNVSPHAHSPVGRRLAESLRALPLSSRRVRFLPQPITGFRDISPGDIAQCKRAHGSRGRKPVLTGSEYVSRAARKFPDSAVLIAGALGYGIGYAD